MRDCTVSFEHGKGVLEPEDEEGSGGDGGGRMESVDNGGEEGRL